MSDLTTTDAEMTENPTPDAAVKDGAETETATAKADAAPAETIASEETADADSGETPAEPTVAAEDSTEDAALADAGQQERSSSTETAVSASEGAPDAAAESQGGDSDDDATRPAATAGATETTAEAAEPAEAPETAAEAAEAAEAPETAAEATATAEASETTAEAAEVTETAAEAVEAAETSETTAGAAEASETAAEAVEGDAAGDAEEKTAVPGAVITVDQDTQPGETMALLERAMGDKAPVEGQIIGWNKGGYHVAIGKIAAFCPVSQIEIGNPRSPKRYLDKSFPFQVIEIQDNGRRVVVSRAAALESAREARAKLVRELLKPGSKVSGKVSSLTDFGAFVDLGGGIEGLVHVSELSRRRVDHPKELLRKGQEVEVSVLKIEKNGERISLSMKRLEPDPWGGVAKRFPSGSKFTGKILRKADFGLFVEIEPGLEGLVHTSRLPLGTDLSDESFEVGNEVSGWIHEVEPRRRRLSLSLRELAKDNPWRDVAKRYPIGEVVQGKVERLASFGAFIELEPGLTGLLPFSVLSVRAGNPRRMFHPGKEVSVRVMSIDRDKRRISLGTEMTQAEGNQQDFKEYLKSQKSTRSPKSGLGSLAAAFEKARAEQQEA